MRAIFIYMEPYGGGDKMNPERRIFLLLFILIIVSFISSSIFTQVPEKKHGGRSNYYRDHGTGYVSPIIDLSYLPAQAVIEALPARWDWRQKGGVSAVKDQDTFNTCWAFAFMGDLESKVLINDNFEFDLSEYRLVACGWDPAKGTNTDCNGGGNDHIAVNYFRRGSWAVIESCDPYECALNGFPPCPPVNPDTCIGVRRVNYWIIITSTTCDSIRAIKKAIMNIGPVYTTMDPDFDEFYNYDGNGCVTCDTCHFEPTDDLDHAVLIVGWDDTLCNGGGWIVKNSWGTDWGDSGFFYIPYCFANIGTYTSVVVGYDYPKLIAYPPYHRDENGWTKNWGFGGYDYGWGLIAVEPVRDELLDGVGFFAVYPSAEIVVNIYDEFDGTSPDPNSLIYSDTMYCEYAGYYTMDMDRTIILRQGDPIFVAVRFSTPGYEYPIPVDSIIDDMDNVLKTGIAQDIKENGKEAIIRRELANHEASYTGDITSTAGGTCIYYFYQPIRIPYLTPQQPMGNI